MFQTVEIPLWLLILILLFAAVTALSHFLLPSVRWFFRRRMERAVAQLNTRLERPIQPFKLARRHDMIQRLIYDPEVIEAAGAWAQANGVPENVGFETAKRYAREIVPRFSATAYFGFAIRLARFISQTAYRVRTSSADESALKGIDKDATVIFVMNHRSNMDYVLVTYLAAERSALSYAVGEWARVWPLTALIRAMGAYFIRRKNSNDLYRKVLERYVQLATKGGVTQAVFPEGGLSLSGEMRPAKLGILSYIVSDFDPEGKDVVFVPVSLNYDRVLEDRILTEAQAAGERRFRFGFFASLGFLLRQLRFKLTGRFHRFGYAAVRFGSPLSLRHLHAETRAGGDLTRSLGRELMQRIGQGMPMPPVPLVAYTVATAQGPLSPEDVTARVQQLAGQLKAEGFPLQLPRGDAVMAAEMGVRILLLRRILLESDAGIVPNPEERALLDFYAAGVGQLLSGAGFSALPQ
ncbi:1-acyl-sn-glycerol-3-phosphate acyltransferase [Pseudoruegeria sp. SHC-113]|uniref:1-acyl-sn-glycerol-3-phosphate acyltransferase n=1 Tax=Pseudoruegeria sp. SHC-113 TaxID=2855439 RepID=UPI0021BA6C86|nr:1-acyl-sn-glycerol-3-phosphate acyltransferase [Pseudoruegeria sp. SHC-113]MCT8161251.1 1-acyl-sn-glycerol-3-phosphate acyltransferase [Pseudoruegeria sp. SHC-113]